MKPDEIKKLYRHDLGSFMRGMFGTYDPYVEYQHNWHIDLMAHYLGMVSRGDIKRLIINMPPRMLKSYCVSIAWPAWELGRNSRKKILCLHGNPTLGQELNASCHALMRSPRYRSLFPGAVLKEDPRGFSTCHGGHRRFMPMKGSLTGLGGDIIIIDDPISTADARNKWERKKLHNQFDDNILQRLSDKSDGAIVLVMQRLHAEDLTNHLLNKGEDWVHLNLPAIALQDEIWRLPHGNVYKRAKGEALHPARESIEELQEILKSVGGYAFANQYLQGAYKPRFGEDGRGCLWLTPHREGVFWDPRTGPREPLGFYHFEEADLILPRVFGIGEDPCPPDMRHSLTDDEMAIESEIMLENYHKMLKDRAEGRL